MTVRCPESPDKRWFATKVEAQVHARRIEREIVGPYLRAYKCLACPGYHLTTKEVR